MAAHGVQQHQGVDQIVGVVLQGLNYALAHSLEPGEMDDGVNIGVLGKEGFHLVLAAQLRLDEGDLPPHNLGYPAHGLLAGVAEVIRHNDVVSGLDEFDAGVAADVARAAADENGHIKHSFKS